MMIISGSWPATETRVIPARRARNVIEEAIEIGEKIEFGDLYSVNIPNVAPYNTPLEYEKFLKSRSDADLRFIELMDARARLAGL
jgi:hypothetical protein